MGLGMSLYAYGMGMGMGGTVLLSWDTERNQQSWPT